MQMAVEFSESSLESLRSLYELLTCGCKNEWQCLMLLYTVDVPHAGESMRRNPIQL